MSIKSFDIYENKCLVNGEWSEGEAASIPVMNPYTGEVIDDVPGLNEMQIERAIDAAHDAFGAWMMTSPQERRRILHRWKDLIAEHLEEIARILVTEQGKPYAEAAGELKYSLSYIDFYADEAIRTYGEVIPAPFPGADVSIIREPVGVVGIITPWNFPTAMFVRKMAPALAAGCTCVFKPDERTPLSAFSLMKLAHMAGFPAGTINCVTGAPSMIGEVFCKSEKMRKISFTGSVKVGKQLMRQSADTLKKLTLELGGNAPFIVFEDANLDSAVEGLMAAKFRNAGQTCVAANRVYVHEAVHDLFIEKLKEKLTALRPGNGLDENIRIGPMIDAKALDKVMDLLNRSLDAGAALICGGTIWKENPNVMLPTLIINVSDDMPVMREEVFGPVVSVSAFKDEDEVVHRANDSEYGLACYVYSESVRRVSRVSHALDYGMVGVNTGIISSALVPFGGKKSSGFGREGGHHGIEEYMTTKYVCVQG